MDKNTNPLAPNEDAMALDSSAIRVNLRTHLNFHSTNWQRTQIYVGKQFVATMMSLVSGVSRLSFATIGGRCKEFRRCRAAATSVDVDFRSGTNTNPLGFKDGDDLLPWRLIETGDMDGLRIDLVVCE